LRFHATVALAQVSTRKRARGHTRFKNYSPKIIAKNYCQKLLPKIIRQK
jgi:hypothetical protein